MHDPQPAESRLTGIVIPLFLVVACTWTHNLDSLIYFYYNKSL